MLVYEKKGTYKYMYESLSITVIRDIKFIVRFR